MYKLIVLWLCVILLVAVPAVGEEVLHTLELQERMHRDSSGEVHLGAVMTVIYPAYALEADEEYHSCLKELAQTLKTPMRKNYRIVLKGYTDSSGAQKDNLKISLQRAEILKKLLVQNPSMAIEQERIEVEGHGASNPVASNETVEGRQRNRRAEIHIYGDVSETLGVVEKHEEVAPGAGLKMTEKKPVPSDQPAISMPKSLFQTEPEVPPTTVRLSLFDTIGYSLEGNQDVLVVSYVPKQAKEDLVEAESVYDPSLFTDGSYERNPNLESSVTNVVTEDEGLLQSGIRQPLKTGGSLSTFLEMGYSDLNNAEFQRKYKYTFAPTVELRQPLLKNLGSKKEQAAIKIASHRFNISEEEFRQNVIEIVTRVSRAYWQLLLFRELVKISQQNFDMAQEVYRREAIRLAEKISKPLDVHRARSNVQARFGILLKSKERYRVVMDQLKLLVNWSNLTIDSKVEIIPIEKPQVVPIDVDKMASIETALNHRPEIEKATEALEIRRVEEDLSSHERLPQLDVFARYSVSGYGREFSSSVDDTGVNDEDTWAVGLNFEYPLGNRSAVARYRKKSLERQQAIAELERFKNQIELDVRQVLLAIDLAKGEIESTRLAQEAGEKVVEGEFARYDLGQVGNEELLRAQDLLAVTSRNHIRAIINYNVAMAELARAQGLLLPGLSIESENVGTLFMDSKPFVRK